MILLWTHFGHYLDTFEVWTYFGHILDTFWTLFGHIGGLDIFWTYFGHICTFNVQNVSKICPKYVHPFILN